MATSGSGVSVLSRRRGAIPSIQLTPNPLSYILPLKGGVTMTGQKRTSLSLSKARRETMAAFDRLPAPLRTWLADARLPWSPDSARRAWRRAMWKSMGRTKAALAQMDQLEEERLARDALTQQRAAEGLVQQRQAK